MDYLPEGFETLAFEKSYINLAKLPEGEYKFRIVKRPIGGWIDWKERKPYRYRPDSKPAKSFDEEKPMKPFWACYVWDYQREGLFILDVNQIGIIKGLTELGKDEDWGDFLNYDIKIKKQGSGKETKYSINPVPHKPMSAAIKEAVEEKRVRLEALYEGRDPWLDLDGQQDFFGNPTQETFADSMEMLKNALEFDGISTDQLEVYIAERAAAKQQSADKLIDSALLPAVLPLFKKMYKEWMDDHPLLQAC